MMHGETKIRCTLPLPLPFYYVIHNTAPPRLTTYHSYNQNFLKKISIQITTQM